MQLSLAEAINIKSLISKKRVDLENRRNQVLTVQVTDKNSDYQKHDISVDVLTEQIHQSILEESVISDLIAKSNVSNEITFKLLGTLRTVTLSNALMLVKRYREEFTSLKYLGETQKERLLPVNGIESYIIAQFEPSKFKEMSDTLERNINALSLAINSKNAQVQLEVPFAEKYL